MAKVHNDWSSEEGLRVIRFVVEQRKEKIPYRKIAEAVNKYFNMPKQVTDEDMKHLYRRKKHLVLGEEKAPKKVEKKPSLDEELKEIYKQMEDEEAQEKAH